MSGFVQQYCLKWNNHPSKLILEFKHFFQTESFTDVTLTCEGAFIKCHKVILAACSSYFHKLFIENECQHPIVILKDIKFSEIKAILEYMYRGEVNVAQDELAGMLKAAEFLRVKGLVEDNHHLSPRSPRHSPNIIPSIPSVSEFQTSNSSSSPKNHSHPGSKFSSADSAPIYETNRNSGAAVAAKERANYMLPPIWPTHKVAPRSPKRNVSDENTQNEPVPLKKILGPNKDTSILRTNLGHTSIQHNAAERSSQIPPHTTPLHQKSLNYALISNNSNGPIANGKPAATWQRSYREALRPIDHTEKMCGEPPEPVMDDSISNVESDRGHNTEDKHGNVQRSELKRYKQYTRNDIMSAIEAVRREGISALQAARKFGVPSRTLYDKVKKLGITTFPTTNHPYREGNFPMSPSYQLNINTESESAGHSPEEQSSDLHGNGNGNGSFSVNGSATDCKKLDSESGLDIVETEHSTS